MKTMTSHSPEETLAAAAKVATELQPGDVVALYGDLGAGKTVFARGIAQALGVTRPVSSPTYTIQHSYTGTHGTIHHIDLYRLMTSDDVDMLDLDACWEGKTITIIEWAEHAGDLLPLQTWLIKLSIVDNNNHRIIKITPPTRIVN